ncbi:hypothetical protein FG386_003317 [Cryptosporidium ryanae]|uniref:uncharacterized protein n=1 Tax=Cryptosporidium ryanae TaxID=515981 RepID=UPI00351AACE2|nr:hypothetical protein FG386_003317 [Cryptosporidium ryanae]
MEEPVKKEEYETIGETSESVEACDPPKGSEEEVNEFNKLDKNTSEEFNLDNRSSRLEKEIHTKYYLNIMGSNRVSLKIN